jgi:hypothetical protein
MATRCGGGGGGGGDASLSCKNIGDTSREVGREDEILPRGIMLEGERSGSIDARGDTAGETARDECRDDTEDGRDKGLWFLTAEAWVRNGFIFRGAPPPSRGGVAGMELFTGVLEPLLARFEAGDNASLCAWKGFRNTVFAFFGANVGL